MKGGGERHLLPLWSPASWSPTHISSENDDVHPGWCSSSTIVLEEHDHIPTRRRPSRPTPPSSITYTGRFVETHRSPEAVILRCAQDLRRARREILRCAQDDTSPLAGSFPKKPPRLSSSTTFALRIAWPPA